MAKIRFKCTCGKALVVDEQYAGQVARCPGRQRPAQVPELPKDEEDSAKPQKPRPTLRNVYGATVQAQQQRKHLKAALDDIRKRKRKRILTTLAVVASTLLLALIVYQIIPTTYNPDIDPVPICAEAFVNGLNRSDPRYRAAAAWEIADFCGNRLTTYLFNMTNNRELIVKMTALWAVVRADRTVAPQYMEKLMPEGPLDVRMMAAFASTLCTSGRLTPEDLAPNIILALDDETEWRAWYESVTDRETPPDTIVTYLNKARQKSKARTRAMTAWMAAATLGPHPLILPLLRDPDPDVIVSAIHALEPFLSADAFEQLKSNKDATRRRLGTLNGIAMLMRNKDDDVRIAAAWVLAQSGQTRVAYALAEGLADDDWFVRFACLKGLAKLPPKLARNAIGSAKEYDPADQNEWIRRVHDHIMQEAPAAQPLKDQ